MNLYSFFLDVVLEHINQQEIDRALSRALRRKAGVLQQSFFDHTPVDYSDELTRLAYMLYYAPRYAIIWREYVSRVGLHEMSELKFNSVGTACGSEIVGILEAFETQERKVSKWVCIDPESGWSPLLDLTCSRYQAARRCKVHRKLYDEPSRLVRGWTIVGSMVLSEIARQGEERTFVRELGGAVGRVPSYFIDAAKYRSDSGEHFVSRAFPMASVESVTRKELGLRRIVNAEATNCHGTDCPHLLAREPGLVMFTLKLP